MGVEGKNLFSGRTPFSQDGPGWIKNGVFQKNKQLVLAANDLAFWMLDFV